MSTMKRSARPTEDILASVRDTHVRRQERPSGNVIIRRTGYEETEKGGILSGVIESGRGAGSDIKLEVGRFASQFKGKKGLFVADEGALYTAYGLREGQGKDAGIYTSRNLGLFAAEPTREGSEVVTDVSISAIPVAERGLIIFRIMDLKDAREVPVEVEAFKEAIREISAGKDGLSIVIDSGIPDVALLSKSESRPHVNRQPVSDEDFAKALTDAFLPAVEKLAGAEDARPVMRITPFRTAIAFGTSAKVELDAMNDDKRKGMGKQLNVPAFQVPGLGRRLDTALAIQNGDLAVDQHVRDAFMRKMGEALGKADADMVVKSGFASLSDATIDGALEKLDLYMPGMEAGNRPGWARGALHIDDVEIGGNKARMVLKCVPMTRPAPIPGVDIAGAENSSFVTAARDLIVEIASLDPTVAKSADAGKAAPTQAESDAAKAALAEAIGDLDADMDDNIDVGGIGDLDDGPEGI